MRHHPKKGHILTIKSGPLTGKNILVIDFLESQYQGKPIHRIKAADSLLAPLKSRGVKLDSDVVFGKLYPTMEFICIPDSELKAEESKPALDIVDPDKVRAIKPKKKKDAHTK